MKANDSNERVRRNRNECFGKIIIKKFTKY